MKSLNRFSTSVATFVAVVGMMAAPAAMAAVTVSHVASTAGPVNVGETFDVEVQITWDGSGSLQGVFSSTEWDNTQLELVGVDYFGLSDFVASLFDVFPPPVFLPGLSRLGGRNQPVDDPTSEIRSIQYGGSAPANAAGAGTDVLVTTLTFEVLAAGDGTAEISPVILQGDSGAVGDTFSLGDAAVVTVPEPATMLLGLASLGSLAGVVAVRRRF